MKTDNKSNAVAVEVCNPFNPAVDSKKHNVVLGRALNNVIDDIVKDKRYPYVVFYNGEPVLRDSWRVTFTKDADVVVIWRLPLGSGSGESGSSKKNPALALAGLALMAVGTFATAGALQFALVGIGSGVAMAGMGILGGVTPPLVESISHTSPTYNLTAQGNMARLGAPIPVVYGSFRVYPDFASAPYSVYKNNKQYLRHVLIVAQGDVNIRDLKVGENDISIFKEIKVKVVPPNKDITLFRSNVVNVPEIGGQELDAPFNWSIGSVAVAPIPNKGGEWLGGNDGFVVCPPATKVDRIEIDIMFPQGLCLLLDKGILGKIKVTLEFEVKEIKEDGSTQPWVSLGTQIIEEKTRDTIRLTFGYNVPKEGRYTIRARRQSDKVDPNGDKSHIQKVQIMGIKGYLKANNNYGNVTALAIEMLATDSLTSQSSRKINCIASAKLREWEPDTGWGTGFGNWTSSSSIPWIVADILTSDYGANLSDDKIDLKGLYYLHSTTPTKSDISFNGVFDKKTSLWEALKIVCRAGRCTPVMQGGVVRVVRDEVRSVPSLMFTPYNIIKDSLTISYLFKTDHENDGVEAGYIDANKDYVPMKIKTDIEGNPLASDKALQNPLKVQFIGIDDKDKAYKLAKYIAKSIKYRRITATLTTGMEGFIATLGDMVTVSHNVPNWGHSGYIKNVSTDGTITLSSSIEMTSGKTYKILCRTGIGGASDPIDIISGKNNNEIKLKNNDRKDWTVKIDKEEAYFDNGNRELCVYFGTAREKTMFSMGEDKKYNKEFTIKKITPKGFNVALELTEYNEDVFI